MLQTIPSQILSSEHVKQNMKVVIIEKHDFIPLLRRKAPLAHSHGGFESKIVQNSPAKVAGKERIIIWLVSPPRMESWQRSRVFFQDLRGFPNIMSSWW